MSRYVIIGTGVAAISAAESIRSTDNQAELTIVGDDPYVYYSRPGLAYYLTGELPEKWLFPYQKGDYQRIRARLLTARVKRILPAENAIQLDSGIRLPYDRLLIATGAQALPLKIPGADLMGVNKLDHLNDAKALLTQAKRGRVAIVTGGGITALELAEGLVARKVTVHYVIRGDRYWPNVLDAVESRIIEERLKQDGIQLHHKSEIVEILGKKGSVVGVQLSDGRQIKCDLVAYAIGITTRIGLALEAGISCGRGILVDQSMRTSHPDIFAAGDVAQVYDPVSGNHILDSLWTPAREQGHTAGVNMSGGNRSYFKPISFNVTRLAGLTTTIIGSVGNGNDPDLLSIARGDSETWRQLPDAILAQEGFEVNRLRLMLGEKHIIGAIIMGDQRLSPYLQAIVREKIDITAIREALMAPNARLADILAGFCLERKISM